MKQILSFLRKHESFLLKIFVWVFLSGLGVIITRSRAVAQFIEAQGLSAETIILLIAIVAAYIATAISIKDLRTSVSALEEGFGVIDAFLSKEFSEYRYLRSQSPTALTEEGETLAKQARAQEIAEKYASQVKVPAKTTPYDIQIIAWEFATEKLRELVSETEENDIKAVAYSHAIKIDIVYKVIGVVLRDHILKQRKLAPSDICLLYTSDAADE